MSRSAPAPILNCPRLMSTSRCWLTSRHSTQTILVDSMISHINKGSELVALRRYLESSDAQITFTALSSSSKLSQRKSTTWCATKWLWWTNLKTMISCSKSSTCMTTKTVCGSLSSWWKTLSHPSFPTWSVSIVRTRASSSSSRSC